MKIKKILTAFAIVSVVSLGNLFAQGISCTMTNRVEMYGITFSTYTCDNGCTSTTISTRSDAGDLSPVADFTSCP